MHRMYLKNFFYGQLRNDRSWDWYLYRGPMLFMAFA